MLKIQFCWKIVQSILDWISLDNYCGMIHFKNERVLDRDSNDISGQILFVFAMKRASSCRHVQLSN